MFLQTEVEETGDDDLYSFIEEEPVIIQMSSTDHWRGKRSKHH